MKRGAPGALPGFSLALLLPCLAGCGGGVPLLHSASVLPPGEVRAGAGLSGQVLLEPLSTKLQQLTVAPGIAPWVGGRVGLDGDNEGGLTYSGRAVRVDGRHAFALPRGTLSVGLGASAIAANRANPSDGNVFGGGFDVPILFGVKSASDLYALWIGPRAGMEFLSGRVGPAGTSPLGDMSVRHFFGGFVAGFRVGFRHIHVALELDGAYHRVDAAFGSEKVGLDQLSLTPGGAILLTF